MKNTYLYFTFIQRQTFSHLMNIEHLATGVYFVKIVASNGACSIVEKFVKN